MTFRVLTTALVAAGLLTAAAPPGPADAATPPVVAVIGDSYTAGWTGTNPITVGTPWYQYTAADLGWTVGNVVADPGGGYLQPGGYGTIPQALAAHPIPATTDYVLLQAGLNDANAGDITGLDAAVAHTLDIIRQQAPNAVVIVVGSFNPDPAGPTVPQQIRVARHIGDAQSIGDTRYIIGFMCTFDLGTDGAHPSAAGHHQIGDYVAWHTVYGLDSGTRLHWNGSYYTA